MIKTSTLSYFDGQHELEAFIATPAHAQAATPLPTVLVCHDWSGRNQFACQKAEKLAELGFVGIALDMYGKGKIGQTNEEKIALMKPLSENRANLRQRLLAGFNMAKQLPYVDAHKIAAIGFCFGGLCALDLARSGAHLCGVVSFHGLLHAPQLSTPAIIAKVLVLHGFDDPMVEPSQVLAFAKEMTDHKVDWQIHMYGHTMHAFTNPAAHDKNFGTVYEAKADHRSWQAMQNFLQECYGPN